MSPIQKDIRRIVKKAIRNPAFTVTAPPNISMQMYNRLRTEDAEEREGFKTKGRIYLRAALLQVISDLWDNLKRIPVGAYSVCRCCSVSTEDD